MLVRKPSPTEAHPLPTSRRNRKRKGRSESHGSRDRTKTPRRQLPPVRPIAKPEPDEDSGLGFDESSLGDCDPGVDPGHILTPQHCLVGNVPPAPEEEDASDGFVSDSQTKSHQTTGPAFLKGIHPVSQCGRYRLELTREPESRHRARYQTEGSRGAVKDATGKSSPQVVLRGYTQPCQLQMYVGSDADGCSPHLFYQACRVTGKTASASREVTLEGTVVMETDMLREPCGTAVSARCDCLGILKQRNVDIETRVAAASGGSSGWPGRRAVSLRKGPRATSCRLVFRVSIVNGLGEIETLQIASRSIVCTQPQGVPEVTKLSAREDACTGGAELILLGKNFVKDSCVVFADCEEEEGGVAGWSVAVQPQKEHQQSVHLVCTVPAYWDQSLLRPRAVSVTVRSGDRESDPAPFTYLPPGDHRRAVTCPSLEHRQESDVVAAATKEVSAATRTINGVSQAAIAINRHFAKTGEICLEKEKSRQCQRHTSEDASVAAEQTNRTSQGPISNRDGSAMASHPAYMVSDLHHPEEFPALGSTQVQQTQQLATGAASLGSLPQAGQPVQRLADDYPPASADQLMSETVLQQESRTVAMPSAAGDAAPQAEPAVLSVTSAVVWSPAAAVKQEWPSQSWTKPDSHSQLQWQQSSQRASAMDWTEAPSAGGTAPEAATTSTPVWPVEPTTSAGPAAPQEAVPALSQWEVSTTTGWSAAAVTSSVGQSTVECTKAATVWVSVPVVPTEAVAVPLATDWTPQLTTGPAPETAARPVGSEAAEPWAGAQVHSWSAEQLADVLGDPVPGPPQQQQGVVATPNDWSAAGQKLESAETERQPTQTVQPHWQVAEPGSQQQQQQSQSRQELSWAAPEPQPEPMTQRQLPETHQQEQLSWSLAEEKQEPQQIPESHKEEQQLSWPMKSHVEAESLPDAKLKDWSVPECESQSQLKTEHQQLTWSVLKSQPQQQPLSWAEPGRQQPPEIESQPQQQLSWSISEAQAEPRQPPELESQPQQPTRLELHQPQQPGWSVAEPQQHAEPQQQLQPQQPQHLSWSVPESQLQLEPQQHLEPEQATQLKAQQQPQQQLSWPESQAQQHLEPEQPTQLKAQQQLSWPESQPHQQLGWSVPESQQVSVSKRQGWTGAAPADTAAAAAADPTPGDPMWGESVFTTEAVATEDPLADMPSGMGLIEYINGDHE